MYKKTIVLLLLLTVTVMLIGHRYVLPKLFITSSREPSRIIEFKREDKTYGEVNPDGLDPRYVKISFSIRTPSCGTRDMSVLTFSRKEPITKIEDLSYTAFLFRIRPDGRLMVKREIKMNAKTSSVYDQIVSSKRIDDNKYHTIYFEVLSDDRLRLDVDGKSEHVDAMKTYLDTKEYAVQIGGGTEEMYEKQFFTGIIGDLRFGNKDKSLKDDIVLRKRESFVTE